MKIARLLRGAASSWAMLLASAGAFAQAITSITIDGPATINSMAALSATYTVTAHRSDGSSSPADTNVAVENDLVLTQSNFGNGSTELAITGLGFASLSATLYDSSGVFTANRTVVVADGAAPPGNPVLDCGTEQASAALDYQVSTLYMAQTTDLLAGCQGRVVVANAGLNRIQVVNVATKSVEFTWRLNARPRRMARLAGTSFLLVALDGNNLARISPASGTAQYAPIASPALDIASFEPGQVVAVCEDAMLRVIDAETFGTVATAALPWYTLSLVAYSAD